jgi:hypothetical protein
MALHRARKKSKEYAWGITSALMGPLGIKRGSFVGRVHVDLCFYPKTDRARDMDNLIASMKGGLDGIGMALGVDDSRFDLSARMGAKKASACVLVTVKPSLVSIEHRGEVGE